MNTSAKMKLLGGVLGVCVITIAVESYYLWEQDKNVSDQQEQTVNASWPDNMNPWPDNWDPTGQIAQLQKQMNEMMNQMSPGQSIFNHHGFAISQASPKITTHEDSDKYQVTIQVPKGDDVKVDTNISGNELTINGTVKQTEQQKDDDSEATSTSISQFSRSMTFADPVDDSKMQVERHDNEVMITVPKVS